MNIFPSACALALAAVLVPASAAGRNELAQLKKEYQQERARCLRGDSNQDRATCLKEAGAAYDEARRGHLAAAPRPELARNATERCKAQPAADRDDCVQRILGGGTTKGSVQGGGVIRQTETTTRTN
jgi:hypothetical protein